MRTFTGKISAGAMALRIGLIAMTVGAVLALFSVLPAQAQVEPTLTFAAETVTGAGSVVPKLTWSTSPAATSCTATGHATWTGAKAASGTATLPALAMSGISSFNLSCTWPGDRTATVNWTAPTQNIDGSALTNLSGYRILYGTSPTELTQSELLQNAAATHFKFENLAPGAWYFRVLAFNTLGVEGELSTTGTKTISANSTVTRTVTITVNPKPNAPSNLTVE